MSGQSSESRRKHKRYNIGCKCRLLLPGKKIVDARLKDVSQGGVGFECLHRLSEGDTVSIEFKPLVGGDVLLIRARGVVRFCMLKSGSDGFYYGLGFSFIGKVEYRELLRLLKYLAA